MREEMLMLRKWNRFIAFILAFALIATTFNSDLASVQRRKRTPETGERQDRPGAEAGAGTAAGERWRRGSARG